MSQLYGPSATGKGKPSERTATHQEESNCSDLRGSADYSAYCGGATEHGISTANRFRPLKREQLPKKDDADTDKTTRSRNRPACETTGRPARKRAQGRDFRRPSSVRQRASSRKRNHQQTNGLLPDDIPPGTSTHNAAPELGATRDHGRYQLATEHQQHEGTGPAARLSAEAAAGWTARNEEITRSTRQSDSRHQSVGRRVQHCTNAGIPRLAKPTPKRPRSRRPMATLRHERMGNGHTTPQAQR